MDNQRRLETITKAKQDVQIQILKQEIENSEIKSDITKSGIITNLILKSNIQKLIKS